jgi:hypothetical protein
VTPICTENEGNRGALSAPTCGVHLNGRHGQARHDESVVWALEQTLWRPEATHAPGEHLHAGFVAQSEGGLWLDSDQSLRGLKERAEAGRLCLMDPRFVAVGASVVLLTYVAAFGRRVEPHLAVWLRAPGGWLKHYHQHGGGFRRESAGAEALQRG